MSRNKRFFSIAGIIFITSLNASSARSQTPAIDSLKKNLSAWQSPADRLSTLLALCRRGESMPGDTMMRYARAARQISISRGDQNARFESELLIARAFYLKGMADTSLRLCEEGIRRLTDMKAQAGLVHEYIRYKIVALIKLRKIKEAIDESFRLLASSEKYNDLSGRIGAYNDLGVTNNILENRAEALKWFNNAYALVRDNDQGLSFPLLFTNLSAMYFRKNDEDSGYFFLRQAFAIARVNQNLRNEADCYTLQGLIYTQQGKIDSAGRMLQTAAALQRQIGNIQFILVGINALVDFYSKQKDYAKAIAFCREAEDYSRKYHEPLPLSFYKDLADCYKYTKNYLAYGDAMDTLMRLKDSMFVKSKAEDLARLEAQYELSSKEAFIVKQRLEILHKDLWISGSALVILLIAAGGYLLFRRNRRRQLVALDAAEEKERRRIAADLHDNIGAYASAISAGIDELEAKKGVAEASFIRNLKNNAVEIITSLRDTIWAFNKESITLTGISDRVKIYAQKIAPNYPNIQISIEEIGLDETGYKDNMSPRRGLSPVRALHIFRIVQEAIHNATRHSGCTAIVVTTSGNGIIIADDGSGFDFRSVQHAGNGLQTMAARAEEAAAELSIERSQPHGTQVRLLIKKIEPTSKISAWR
jgi:signal transduction histidine kinase